MSAPKLASYYSEKQDDGRYYKIPYTGDTAASDTTILKGENKDNLIQWSADRVAWFFATNPTFGLTRTADATFQGARFKHNDFRDERAEIGTAVHNWIEADLDGGWQYPELWDEEVIECVAQWKLFLEVHNMEALHVETTVWSEENGYAGTLDFYGYIDGELWLLDLKTSKNLWDGHEYQLAALEQAEYGLVECDEDHPDASPKFVYTDWETKEKFTTYWRKITLEKPVKRGFLHIRPTYTDPQTGDITPAFWDLVEVDAEDIPALHNVFLGYAQAHSGKAEVKALRKSREPDKVNW